MPDEKKTKPIRLRLGGFTDTAFTCARVHREKLRSYHVKGATVFIVSTPADRVHALAILYYMESSPAFYGDDTEKTERSAIMRTTAKWRAQLGLTLHEKLPTPYTAERMNINKPSDEEAARERAAGIES